MQRRTLWLIASIAGVGLATLAFGGGLLVLAMSLVGDGALTAVETLPAAGLQALSLALGVALTLHGWAGWEGRSSHPFNPPPLTLPAGPVQRRDTVQGSG